jgi:two-component system chemotaxis sensor kinase CheA
VAGMADFRSGMLNFLLSGKFKNRAGSVFTMEDAAVRYIALNIILAASSVVFLLYSLLLWTKGNDKHTAELSIMMTTVCVAGIITLRTRLSFFNVAVITVAVFSITGILFLRMGTAGGFSSIWIFIVPPIAYSTLGIKGGAAFSLGVLAASVIVFYVPGLSGYDYSLDKTFRVIGVYSLLFIIAVVYETVRVSKSKKVDKLNRTLKYERDEFSVMLNNLKTGIFLMDKDLIIQDAYSMQLLNILDTSDLSGRKFTSLLTSCLTSAEISTITDFFDMVRTRRFDAEMLEDINPLQDLNYKSVGSGTVKILKCIFTPIDHDLGDTLIMGNIEDITTKVELQKKLLQEEAKRHEEMSALFEMLQIDRSVFNDFIEDVEYEFDAINDILKNSRVSSKDALTSIFQSIHAIKANSIIIGLNSYSRKIHDIETYIKQLQEKPDVIFDDILALTVRIEEIMKTKDGFKASVEKIKSFSSGESRKSAADILSESLERAANRTAGSLGKKVVLDTAGIDADALNCAPRRVVKEVLLQFVRNAVFHGIESPEERARAGKKESGLIAVSLKLESGKIHVKFQDDGRGLDFEKIKERAQKMHIIKKSDGAEDKGRIFQAIFMPGFSTAENAGIYAGRGIGLNLVRSRIKELGGAIKTQTEAGKGTAFHIFLPIEKSAGEGI